LVQEALEHLGVDNPSWIMNCMAPSRPMAEIIWIEVRAPVLRTMGVLPTGPQVVPQW
jgi:hypothetical protein